LRSHAAGGRSTGRTGQKYRKLAILEDSGILNLNPAGPDRVSSDATHAVAEEYRGDQVLEQKIALVTGGSAGIGLATARRLAALGARVALVARTEKTLRDAAQELGGEAFVCDMNDLSSVAALPASVVARMGALDIVVNNAGVHHRGSLLSIEPLALGHMITVNLAAPVVLCRAAVPLLRKPGSIVNVASLAGMVPMRFQVTYGASKAGLRSFSRALRDELAGSGVTVSVVSPGPVDTGFFGEQLERVADLVFSQPMSSTEDVARAIVRCIEEGTSEIALPWLSGKLCTLGYLSPALTRLFRSGIEKRGARNKRAYIERKRSTR
jgi:short-subunit dehydrogenase